MSLGSEAIFDNRELAILLWLAVVVAWAVIRRDVRASLGSLVRTARAPKLAVPLLLMSGYIATTVVAFWSIGIWTWDLFSETVFWFAGTALVLFVSLDQASSDPRFFRHVVVRVLSFTVFIQFVVNVYTLSLAAELALVPALFILGAMLALSQSRQEYRQLQGCLGAVVSIVGIALLLYSVARAIRDPESFLTATNLRELVAPVLLTLCLLPFLYGLAVWANYDGLFIRLRLHLPNHQRLHRYLCRRLLLATGPRLRAVIYASRAPGGSSSPHRRAEAKSIVQSPTSSQEDRTVSRHRRSLRSASKRSPRISSEAGNTYF
jgi:hypothetical protein